MADFPKICAKITKHKPPRYMLYQPGFNEYNSCWLDGKWIYVSKEEYEEKHELQNDMYSNLRELSKGQHHRDEGTLPTNMNPAQKQAFEFFSGTSILKCMVKGNYFSPISVRMAANKRIWEKDIEWMRRKGFQIIRYIKSSDEEINQIEGLEIPEDLIIDKNKPVDTVKMTVDQNKRKSSQMFEAMFEHIEKQRSIGMSITPIDLCLGMIIHSLLELEKEIIRHEWHKKYNKKILYDTYNDDIEEYVRQRAKIKEFLGDRFESLYNEKKKEQNSCNKTNRDNGLYSWVLPKFNDDGTHEPWTENDVPDPKEK